MPLTRSLPTCCTFVHSIGRILPPSHICAARTRARKKFTPRFQRLSSSITCSSLSLPRSLVRSLRRGPIDLPVSVALLSASAERAHRDFNRISARPLSLSLPLSRASAVSRGADNGPFSRPWEEKEGGRGRERVESLSELLKIQRSSDEASRRNNVD